MKSHSLTRSKQKKMYRNTYSAYHTHWQLDTSYLFLNHGSFGACPVFILNKQNEYREMMEHQPLKFMVRQLPELLHHSKQRLADFTGSSNSNLVFVRNATSGVNTVLNSFEFNLSDEVIITNHIYPACRNAVNFYAEKKGFKVKQAIIPFPIENEQIVIDRIAEQITGKTRLILIDHISSPTGLLFPVEKIINEFQYGKIDCLIDGAHAPGNIPLNLENLGAAYYTGNCHKWICSPKGSAFLYVRPDRQENIHPLVISLTAGKNTGFEERFYWTGTSDPTPYICVGHAIDYMAKLLPGGWKEIMIHNHNLAMEAMHYLCSFLKTPLPCPESMIANLVSFPLKDTSSPAPVKFNQLDELQERLFHEHNIELFVTYWPQHPNRLFRISPQIYNTFYQYQLLAEKI